ncbi:lysophospholipid acyltransferase family protein [Rhodococcus sp. NPDC058532]|uniref:lysophospholipid acyltransferase family protein n=1 Tax=Rhodococcus sp. NPDC058532 TaxID=3346540 RepID=UPI003666ACE6
MTHAWMPSSPCGDGCVSDHGRRAGPVRTGLRCVGVAVLVSGLPVLVASAALPPRWRSGLHRGYARSVLRILGLRLRVRDERDPAPGAGGVLVVAAHVSWLDVLALTAVDPGTYVARADLLDWPLIGPLTRRLRVVPIDRARLRALPAVVDEVTALLRRGRRVVVFPEGTTWCGRAGGRLRPALFQAAIDAGTPVAPVALRYVGPGGPATGACFVGEQTLVGSLVRVVRLRDVHIDVRLAPLQRPGTDRRELATRCERLVRGGHGPFRNGGSPTGSSSADAAPPAGAVRSPVAA